MRAPADGLGRRRPLRERLGVEAPDDLRGSFRPLLDRTAERAVAGLRARGRLRSGWVRPRLELPASLSEVLEVALATAQRDGPAEHAAALRFHYLEGLPGELVEQLCTADEPEDWLFHTPGIWDRLPSCGRVVGALFDVLAAHGIEASPALGAASAAALLDARATLADLYRETYYGALFPLFQARRHDLLVIQEEAGRAGPDPTARWAVVDAYLAAPLLHELLHFGRAREAIYPPYLDEALAGYLGVHLYPETAYPEGGRRTGLVGWPWFAQVGQALVRAFGMGPVLSAQAGHTPWEAALGRSLVEALERLAWEAYRARPAVHFHPDSTRPDRWVKLFYMAARGEPLAGVSLADMDALEPAGLAPPLRNEADGRLEREMLVCAIAAMSLDNRQERGSWRAAMAAPPGPVVLDLRRGLCTTDARRGSLEPAPPLHVLPPSWCAGRLDAGVVRLEASVAEPSAAVIEDLADGLLAGLTESDGAGWSVRPG